ncbi:MAG: zinc ribbon domain-containing protein [Pseudomonadota bacterium]
MPIYEYACQECGHTLDALQKIADEPLRDCPACKAPALKRKISAPNFRLKGQGWYETDFKKDGDKKRNLAESDSSKPKPEKDAKSKTDSASTKTSSDGGKAA